MISWMRADCLAPALQDLKIGLILNDLNKSLKAMKTCFAWRQNMYNLVRVTFLVSLSSSYNYPLSRKSLNGIDINTAL